MSYDRPGFAPFKASRRFLTSARALLFLEGTEPEVIFYVEGETHSNCRGVTIAFQKAPSTTSWSSFLG